MSDENHKDEYEALLEMARDKTAAGRATLASTVTDLFAERSEVLTDHERALMSDILRQLIHDAEMSVRRELSNKLASFENIPHELVVLLANDDIEVAHPILVKSELLCDLDLIEIIHHRTLQHQLSIALRRSISEDVSTALVESGDEDVIKALLENPNARISRTTMEYLVEQSKRVDSYQNPLLKRPDLDPQLAKSMYWWVSAALRKYVTEHFDIDPWELDENLDTTVNEIAARESEAGIDIGKAQELAKHMAESDHITSELMVRILRQGEIPLFEALFARRSGLRLRLLQRILFEPGGEALAVVCRALEIAKADFATMFMLTRKARGGERTVRPGELNRVLEIYDRVRLESARRMLSRWQRDPGYLDAVRILSASEDETPASDDPEKPDGSGRP
ncbi:MAG: DUF2336 domain-containing protein [Alphaproteobacteria bacterium]|nr:DUF2336 domain-containing protein [Alphaproteobacteria bacterium]